jgi:uncharacterized protein YbcV (DUF1398 family)
MFTIEELTAAHAKVRSGADFPAYIKEIRNLGVSSYETYVADGHTDFLGKNGHEVSSQVKYGPLEISPKSNAAQFRADLKTHQQGASDYPTFCSQCAAAGIVKWIVDMEKMTCTYFDAAGEEVLSEEIPS